MAYVAIGCVAVASDPSFHNVESNFNNLCTQHWPAYPTMLQVSLLKTSMTDIHIESQQVFGWSSCGIGAKQEGMGGKERLEGVELELMNGLFGPVIDTIMHMPRWYTEMHTHTAYVYTVHTYVLNKRHMQNQVTTTLTLSLHGLVHSQSIVHGQACSCI